MMRNLGPVPNLVVAERVINKMVKAASQFMEDETGEAMIGLVTEGTNTGGIPTIYVLDTISPDESAVRQLHTFVQGDIEQEEILWWLKENWRVKREKYFAESDRKFYVPLRYLGDWHKQPGYMIAPSSGDRWTAMELLNDPENETDYLLVPILTLGHPSTTASGNGVSNYTISEQDDDSSIRVDWWYIHRDVGQFQPIVPAVYPDDQLPTLAAYPWHLTDDARYSIEIGQLEHDGLFVSAAILWDTDGGLPLEVAFILARQGASKVMLLVTESDFPKTKPHVRLAPFQQMTLEDDTYDMFEKLWVKAEVVDDPPDWKWSDEQYLIDYIHAIEAHYGLAVANHVEDVAISEEASPDPTEAVATEVDGQTPDGSDTGDDKHDS